MVAPAGFEPAISALKGRRPGPLDDGATHRSISINLSRPLLPRFAGIRWRPKTYAPTMSAMDDNLPVIVGVGQVTQRPGTERPREPLALMAEAARNAETDSGAPGLLQSLDSVRVISIMSWPSKDPPGDLSRA